MYTKAGVGMSHHRNPVMAGREAVETAIKTGDIQKPDLGFETPGHMEGYDDYMIRFMPAKNDETGSVTIQTEVVEGTNIRMTRRDYEKVAGGIERLAGEINDQLRGTPAKLVFQFDCCGRGKVFLREHQKMELLSNLQKQIPDAPWMGFYTLREIGPVGKANCFHNYTAVVAAIH